MVSGMKKVLLITTGGTIAQTRHDGMMSADKGKGGGTLLSNVIHKNIADIDTLDLFCVDSSNITPLHWKKLINSILDNHEKYDAIVVTHGTDTMSYTCAALSFALGNINIPVVLTGAQVPFGEPGSDAEVNLENALRVAVCEKVLLKGVVCVFGSRIITGTRVKKLSEYVYDSFDSFNKDCLGRIGGRMIFDDKRVQEHNAMYGKEQCRVEFDMGKVLVLNEFPGLNWEFVKGAKAVVLAAYSYGDSNVDDLRGMYDYLRQNKIPIAVTSQPLFGIAEMVDYATGVQARELGGVPAHDMSIEALTVKMGWLIGQGLGYDEVKTALLTNVRGEIETGGVGK